ncbi:MAG: hypothetical protein HQM11_04925 [SAR324 cluster bacterium]|nr:hypothetical protein [SAR324 cluster bacterium]
MYRLTLIAQPVDNLGYYWFKAFVKNPTLQSIGFVAHAAAEVGAAQHTWNTMGNYHVEYEEWAEDHHFSDNLGDFDRVHEMLKNYSTSKGFRVTLTQTAQESYAHAEPLFNASNAARLNAARDMAPMSIATIVTVWTKAVNKLYGE